MTPYSQSLHTSSTCPAAPKEHTLIQTSSRIQEQDDTAASRSALLHVCCLHQPSGTFHYSGVMSQDIYVLMVGSYRIMNLIWEFRTVSDVLQLRSTFYSMHTWKNWASGLPFVIQSIDVICNSKLWITVILQTVMCSHVLYQNNTGFIVYSQNQQWSYYCSINLLCVHTRSVNYYQMSRLHIL